ncbi:hypothetical protein [Coleofasciculus sp. FACHB-SPT9]|nr:hypothetical protein [Coleofasciculus sp. FACHB-SPT9]
MREHESDRYLVPTDFETKSVETIKVKTIEPAPSPTTYLNSIS